jgi:hypothetical protein
MVLSIWRSLLMGNRAPRRNDDGIPSALDTTAPVLPLSRCLARQRGELVSSVGVASGCVHVAECASQIEYPLDHVSRRA